MVTFDLHAVFCIGPEYGLRSTPALHFGAAPRAAASFNKALQRTRPSRHCCNRGVPWAGSLSLGRSGRIAFVAMSDISSFRYCRPASVGAPCHGVSRIVHGTALGLSISSPRGIMTHLMIARSSPLSSAKRRALGVSTLPRRSDAASIHSAPRPEQGASVNWPGSFQFGGPLPFSVAVLFAASH